MSSEEVKAERAGEADAAQAAAEANAEAVKAARPKHRRMRDMALSMAVLLVPLGLVYWGWGWIAADRQVSVVDTAGNLATAASLGLPAIEPELSEDWKPISTHLAAEGETATLRTGWYSPDGNGLQMSETSGAATEVDEDLTGAGTPVEAGGIQWTSYELDSGEAWVAEIDGATVVLSAEPDGIPDLDELAEGVAAAR
ncbi:DUF4245 family protein [Glycomyces terrestris]|uniref:DUF4245 domain-containing protein n=1 Tax=Glycomyces terrestris TaxID=2493553 RepID=A0A426UU93_9ACTN|nr:DUF4245 family protein [Glycomyces terrestris]RRR97552.1 DUF4245 domain-containing protein [Glycomyces terrestris]